MAFPGVDLGLVAWVGLAPWLAWIPGRSPGRAALGGLVAGIVFHLVGLWWIADTMMRHGNLPDILVVPVAASVLLVLALYLSLFPAAFAAALAWLHPATAPAFVLSAAILWIALEYLRAHLLSGFPWNLLGYSQYQNFALLPLVTVTGVYGLSFLVLAVNASLAWGLVGWGRGREVGSAATVDPLGSCPWELPFRPQSLPDCRPERARPHPFLRYQKAGEELPDDPRGLGRRQRAHPAPIDDPRGWGGQALGCGRSREWRRKLTGLTDRDIERGD